MSEFEIQQLIIAARADFDAATTTFLGFSLLVMAMAIFSRSQWDRRTRWLFIASYLVTTAFLIFRVLAAMLRFGKAEALLQAPAFKVMAPMVQAPTFALRVLVFVLFIWLTLHLLREQKQ